MTVVPTREQFSDAYLTTREVARAVFSDPAVYVERFLPGARHVEVQVLCDQHGNGVSPLGERDCSLQRRHQKLLEEAPAARLTPARRERLGALAVRGALSVGYTGAGTVEFLIDGADEPYFMEMNARIRVEHPITELVTGIDLVREQIPIADGVPLVSSCRRSSAASAPAMECRISTEDPARGFAAALVDFEDFGHRAGRGARLDTGYREGHRVSPHYDSLIAKLIVWAPTRDQALDRMDRALAEMTLEWSGPVDHGRPAPRPGEPPRHPRRPPRHPVPRPGDASTSPSAPPRSTRGSSAPSPRAVGLRAGGPAHLRAAAVALPTPPLTTEVLPI
ncbi:hypothetical protein Q0F99_17930 [Rathayibacter oskolensis]|uniref:ATP-binding protein n=1 Tax=Rathayibacter oskolensis TaxID=1891671 RepID=UPI002660295D|nr:hypothetical protein [Rathayibacter oskolensis]WKK71306.1 hypothetical protein Q0F99_17930 [Rathayibacter oskolensis]